MTLSSSYYLITPSPLGSFQFLDVVEDDFNGSGKLGQVGGGGNLQRQNTLFKNQKYQLCLLRSSMKNTGVGMGGG